MFQVSDVVQLNAGERVQTLVRVHSAYLWGKLVVAGLLVIIPFFFLFSLLRSGAIGIIVFVVCTGVGIVLALRSFFLWDAQVLILTDQRVVYVIQRSLWHRLVSEAALDTIRDLQWEQANMIERVLHCGTVRIKTGASSVPDMTVPQIPGPEELVRAIKSLREHGNGKIVQAHPVKEVTPEISLDERREHIHAWVSDANTEILKKLEHLMREDRSHRQKR